jgi:hypothetical protein
MHQKSCVAPAQFYGWAILSQNAYGLLSPQAIGRLENATALVRRVRQLLDDFPFACQRKNWKPWI